jgi:DNA processing protein
MKPLVKPEPSPWSPGGVDIVYPPENAALTQGISEKGAIISDMPPGFEPRSKDSRRRNRIISGIALTVLVIEAAKRSAKLVTARLAGEQGREVFAVPGHPHDPHAEGPNGLLKSGATLVTTPDDIIEAGVPLSGLWPDVAFAEQSHWALAAAATGAAPLLQESDRARVLEALGPAPVDIDALMRAIGLDTRTLNVVLMELDLAGRIVHHGAGWYPEPSRRKDARPGWANKSRTGGPRNHAERFCRNISAQ